jgi:hypothetical protein
MHLIPLRKPRLAGGARARASSGFGILKKLILKMATRGALSPLL